jgi:hypothetical protein
MLRQQKSPQGRNDPSAFLTKCRGNEQGLSDRLTILSLSSYRNSAFAAGNFSASSRRKREAMGGLEVLMWCSTSVQTGGRTLEGHTTSSNSARNAFNHSGDSGGGAGGLAALSVVASPPQRPVDSGDGGYWMGLAAQAAAAETFAKDCSDAVSTRQHLCRRHHAVLLRRRPHAQKDPRKMIWPVIRHRPRPQRVFQLAVAPVHHPIAAWVKSRGGDVMDVQSSS